MRFSIYSVSMLLIFGFGQLQDKQEKPEPPDNIEIVSESLLREINEYITEKQWTNLIGLYKYIIEDTDASTNLRKFYPDPDPETKAYLSFFEFIIKKFSALPRGFITDFRITFDHKVAPEFKKPREKWNVPLLEKLLERYFFSSYSDELMEALANYYIEQGNVKRAMNHLRNLLNYPFPDISISNAIARLALCYRLTGKPELINGFKTHKKYQQHMNDKVTFQGEKLTLSKYLEKVANMKVNLGIQPAPHVNRDPSIMDPHDTYAKTTHYPKADQYKYNQPFSHSSRITGSIDTHFAVLPVYAEFETRDKDTKKETKINALIIQDGQAIRIINFNNGKLFDKFGVEASDLQKPERGSTEHGYPYKYSRFGPFITSQIEGDIILANMYSAKIRDEVKEAVGELKEKVNYQVQWKPAPLNTLRAFNLRNYKLVYSTDEAIRKEREKNRNKDRSAAEFAKGDFSFSLPVVALENKIYTGIIGWGNTINEQTSYVACFELDTNKELKLRWYTQLSSRSLPQHNIYDQRQLVHLPLSATFVLEKDGIIYACTNTGSVAALDSFTGRVLWLSIYSKPRGDNPQSKKIYARPASYPILHKDFLYFLPMDEEEIVIIDTVTGKRLPPFDIKKESGNDWAKYSHLQGIVKGPVHDFIVMSGSRNTVSIKLNNEDPSKSTFLTTIEAQTAIEEQGVFRTVAGHGAIVGDYIFIPTCVTKTDPTTGQTTEDGIKILRAGPWKIKYTCPAHAEVSSISSGKCTKCDAELAKTANGAWKMVHTSTFKNKDKTGLSKQYGNLVIVGNKIIIGAEEHVFVYQSAEGFMDESRLKLAQDPVNPTLLAKIANELYSNKKYEDAIELLTRLENLCKGDTERKSLLDDAQEKLFDSYLKLGLETSSSSAKKAINLFKKAIEYARGTKQLFNALYRSAELYESEKDLKNAVEHYQMILFKTPKELSDRDTTGRQEIAWLYAYKRIEEIKKANPKAYEVVEEEAKTALKTTKADINAWLGLLDNYPNSSIAQTAIKTILQLLEKETPDKKASIIQSIRQRYENLLTLELFKKLLESLEKIGDSQRLEKELRCLLRNFSDATVNWGGKDEKLADYVIRKLEELRTNSLPAGNFEKIASIPPSASSHRIPIIPLGTEHPWFQNGKTCLLLHGSDVEIWDVTKQKCMQIIKHPGTFLGIKFKIIGSTVVVESRAGGSTVDVNRGDVILKLNDTIITPDNFAHAALSLEENKEHSITLQRDGDRIEKKFTSSPDWPKSRFVGACFTSDYKLILCWQDSLASIDTTNFMPKWLFSRLDLGDITSINYSDGRILVLHEMTENSEFYAVIKPTKEEEIELKKKLELFSSLACIDDQNGNALWINTFKAIKGASVTCSFDSRNCTISVSDKSKIPVQQPVRDPYYYEYNYSQPQVPTFSTEFKIISLLTGKIVRNANYSGLINFQTNRAECTIAVAEKGKVSSVSINSDELVSLNHDFGQNQNAAVSSDGNFTVVVTNKIAIFDLRTQKRVINDVDIGSNKTISALIIKGSVFVHVQDTQSAQNATLYYFDLKDLNNIKSIKAMAPVNKTSTFSIIDIPNHYIACYENATVHGNPASTFFVHGKSSGLKVLKSEKGKPNFMPLFYKGMIFLVNSNGELEIYK